MASRRARATHGLGQEQAPAYLRGAGLVDRLRAAGVAVRDYGDLPPARYAPDPAHPRRQNQTIVAAVAMGVAERVAAVARARDTPLVLGGDCTIELGVLAGLLRHGDDLGLLYLDGHVDLNTPATTPTGIFDGMGLAHIIGAPGAADELSRLGPRYPLLPADAIALIGYNPRVLDAPERAVLAAQPFLRYPLGDIAGRAADAAREALARVEGRGGRVVAHVDVDVIDAGALPLADWPPPPGLAGLALADALACLDVFAASPRCAALVVTEVNPDRAGADPAAATPLIDGLVRALAAPGTADRAGACG